MQSPAREGDVGQGTEGDQRQPGMGTNGLDDGFDSVRGFGRAARRRISAIAQTVLAVEPFGVDVFAQKRLFRARKDGHAGATEFSDVERVAGSLGDAYVAGDDGDGAHVDIRGAQRHDQGDGIVGSRVGIDQEGPRQATRIARRAGLVRLACAGKSARAAGRSACATERVIYKGQCPLFE
jgi:hypothetical protein